MNPFDRDQELGEFHGCEISIKLLIVLCKYPSLARGLFLQDSIKITITNHCWNFFILNYVVISYITFFVVNAKVIA